mgnify:CR=1 FL=1
MSTTYRVTYTLGDERVSRALYITTADPQLGTILAALQGVSIGETVAIQPHTCGQEATVLISLEFVL